MSGALIDTTSVKPETSKTPATLEKEKGNKENKESKINHSKKKMYCAVRMCMYAACRCMCMCECKDGKGVVVVVLIIIIIIPGKNILSKS